MNKFKVMLRILDNYPPLYKRLSTKLYGILLKFFVRIIYSRIFRKIVNLRYDSFRKSPIPPLCPSLNSNRLPPEYVKFIKESKRLDELDQRYPYLYIQSILEFLLEKKSGYPMVSKKSNSSLFLVQQLPQSLLDKIKDSV